ncbi:MAG: STAS domain-containing protein [Spirochaetes bacterium]|nr:STAS domain-containing protein [Spirochaetota bacterium]MBN2771708.1 STAS domain-containing protein [Spirochaetota bacterium]HRX15691.1 STAS domain-containing protein [Spirochaetota bacterium]
MDIKITENESSVLVKVSGDIEMMTIKDFKDQLLLLGKDSDKDIELDMGDVNYIDSSGVGVLISLLKLQKKKDKSVTITEVSDKVLNVLKLSSLADVFDL